MSGCFSCVIKSDLLSNTGFNIFASRITKLVSEFMAYVVLVAKVAPLLVWHPGLEFFLNMGFSISVSLILEMADTLL